MTPNPSKLWSCFLAILYYDYLLTLPWEIQFLWSPGKQRWFTVACLLNRYLSVFGYIPLAVSYFKGDPPVRASSLSHPPLLTETRRLAAVVSYCGGASLMNKKAYQTDPVQLSGFTPIPRNLRNCSAVAGWPYVYVPRPINRFASLIRYVNPPREVLCLVRVYALYGRSRRILGVLLSFGAGTILVTCVRFPLAHLSLRSCLTITKKWAMIGSRHAAVETIQVISIVPGCNQFMPIRG